MNKLIIDNRTDMSMLEALKYVTRSVKKRGLCVSRDVYQYCFIIKWDDGGRAIESRETNTQIELHS
jgi:hypothetical protein